MSDHKEDKSFSRFGYIMVAAGAAIGVGELFGSSRIWLTATEEERLFWFTL